MITCNDPSNPAMYITRPQPAPGVPGGPYTCQNCGEVGTGEELAKRECKAPVNPISGLERLIADGGL